MVARAYRLLLTGMLLGLAMTVLGQSMPPDSTNVLPSEEVTPVLQKSEIDTVVSYQSTYFENYVQERVSVFTGNAVVKYKDVTLKAEKITIDWNEKLMIAEGVNDSVMVYNKDHSDSTIKVVKKGSPVLIESGSEMNGARMIYNYETEKGLVVRGRTQFEGGFYRGDQIKRARDDVFFVSHSSFTTCDLDSNPHFHFESRRLKMIPNDKVIAKPVVMYLGHVPIAALPFAVFPHQKGRHSGIIVPRYGQSAREGRYLRELGYYWAPNDYFDGRGTVDFFEKSGWLFRAGANYAVRYSMNGSVSGSLTRKNFESIYGQSYSERRWDLQVRHNQDLSPTSHLSASGYFVSDQNFYRDLSTNLDTRLTRELRSNLTYSKNWPQQKLSFSMNLSRVHDLEDDTKQQIFPQLNVRLGQTQIFTPAENNKKNGRRQRTSRQDDKWYHFFYFSYGSNLLNSKREYRTTVNGDQKETERTRQLSHDISLSLNSPKRYFGWLSLNQSLNINEDWFDESKRFRLNREENSIEEMTDKGFAARHTFSYNASANTKLYGLFTPGIGDIQAFRHVVTPSVSFRYQPDFSDPKWGYFTEVTDTSGNVVKRDRFGGTPSSGSKSISMSVSNLFQMKKGYGEKAKKIDLFNMNFSSGFNFNAERNKLSDLRTSWQANPASNFSFSASTSHSFYRWDEELQRTTNKYIFDDNGWRKGDFARLTNLSLNFSLRLQGQGGAAGRSVSPEAEEEMTPEEIAALPPENQEVGILEEENLLNQADRFGARDTYQRLTIPWRLNLNFNFSLSKFNPYRPVKNYYLRISGAELKLTKNWRIEYNAQYNLEKRRIVHHSFNFYRDLHCWEARIDWVPSGLDKRVYFRINIKSSVLQDIKLEKRGGRAASALGY
jgi:lipopolysaccharide assembly outer membrane protein LptD (OstA)